MDDGWVKIHRKMLEWDWAQDPNTSHLFLSLLLMANHRKKSWKGIEIMPGQLLTGRKKLSSQTGLTERQVRTSLNKLKSTNDVTINSTSQYSIIEINNWSKYQQSGQQTANERPTSDQRVTTNKNVRKKERIIYIVGQLNEITGKSFKPSAKSTISPISARIDEGYSDEEFVRVIKTKHAQWRNDPDMMGYLRPSTLFGTKFESYLNEKPVKTVKKDLVEFYYPGQ